MNIKQELLRIASDLDSEKYIKEFILVYESFFKSLEFTVKTKLDIATNSYSKQPNFFNLTMIASKENTELTLKAIIGYDVNEKSNAILILSGKVDDKAIRRKRDSFSVKDALIPTKFINKKNLEKAMNTAINKKFSRADAMILIDKNFMVSDRFGSPREQDPDLFIQVTDEVFVKISRMKFRRVAYWQCIGVYVAEGKHRLTFDNTIKVTKSFEETEEGMKDLVIYIKQIQIQVRKELAKNNVVIVSKKKEVEQSLKDIFLAHEHMILKYLKISLQVIKTTKIDYKNGDELVVDFESKDENCEKINLQIAPSHEERKIRVDLGYILKNGSPIYESEYGYNFNLDDMIHKLAIKLRQELDK